jgi:Lon protease-like protein
VTERAHLPLFPLNTVLFPGGPLPLRIFEPRYVDMIGRCMRERLPFGVVLIVAGAEVGELHEVASVGTTASIVDFETMPDGLLGITCRGDRRFRLLSRSRRSDGLNVGEVEYFPDSATEPVVIPERHRALAELLREVFPELGEAYAAIPRHFEDAAWVGYRLAELLPLSGAERIALLELQDPIERLARLAPLIVTRQ